MMPSDVMMLAPSDKGMRALSAYSERVLWSRTTLVLLLGQFQHAKQDTAKVGSSQGQYGVWGQDASLKELLPDWKHARLPVWPLSAVACWALRFSIIVPFL